VPQDHVIHVAHVAGDAELFLDPVVHRRQILVGEVLAGQIADRDTPTGLCRVALDQSVQEGQQRDILEEPPQGYLEPVMRDAVKVLAHVQLQVPEMAARVVPGTLNTGMQALALAAGIAVVDLTPLEHRLTDVDDGVVQHPLPEWRRTDKPLLRVVDSETVVVAEMDVPRNEFVPQGIQFVVQARPERLHVRSAILAAPGPPERQAEILRLGDAFVEIPGASHAGVSPGFRNASMKAAPYRAALASPKPSIPCRTMGVSSSALAISANCSLVQTP